jgi:antitoxin VapB
MAVLIRDPEADRLIRELAGRCGETITEAVRKAVEQRLARTPPRKGRVDRDKLAAAHAYFDALPRQNEHLTNNEIIGYNEEGHFD